LLVEISNKKKKKEEEKLGRSFNVHYFTPEKKRKEKGEKKPINLVNSVYHPLIAELVFFI